MPESRHRIRLVFMGTADLAAAVLARLAESPDCEILAVVSQPDRPKGRDLAVPPTPVKAEALRRSLPVLQPLKARAPEFLEQLRQLAPDLIVVAAYGQLLPQALLDIPRHGCLNVHTSILPRYRGAAPIQWAIANGDPETGVTIMRMDAGLDTGPMVAVETTPIDETDTGQTLHDRLARIGADLLVRTLRPYVDGSLPPRPQPAEGVTYARKITKEDGRIDWKADARLLHHRFRAFTPWPGAFCFIPGEPKPRLLKVHAATVISRPAAAQPGDVFQATKDGIGVACGTDALRLTVVQPEGGRRLTAAEFLAGHTLSRLE